MIKEFIYKILDGDKHKKKGIIDIGVDFDGTLIEKVVYPNTNYILKPNAKKVLKELKELYPNIEFILFTARTGWYRKTAINFIKNQNLPIKCSMKNCKPRVKFYIDDSCIYCNNINWLEIKDILIKKISQIKV